VILGAAVPARPVLEFLSAIKDLHGEIGVGVVALIQADDFDLLLALLRHGAHELVRCDAPCGLIRAAMANALRRANAQRLLDEQHAELERLYLEAQQANAALREARDLAEQASHAKDEFLALLSHELRTPLTPVLSLVSATLTEPQPLSADLRETFTLIRRNVQLEARMIDDLLDLTRVMQGQIEVQNLPVDLHACAQAAIEVCQPALDQRQVVLHTAFVAVSPMVSGDFARLQQVLWSLLKNAADFTPVGGRIDLTTRNDGGSVMVEIRDTGVGIPPERLADIFAALNMPGSRRAGSLGLGLSISRAIVEAHGGQLTAASDGTGRGAVFVLRLPEISAAARSGVPATASRSARRHTILIVEDHDDTRRVLSRALRRRGFGVSAATSVESACEYFARQPPDLMICDIGLPDGTGWDVLQRLRGTVPVRAVAVSGYGMARDLERSRAAGFLAHLTKPVDFVQLERLIVTLLAEASPPKDA
jgi:signal transduction histidine kinase/ActR/RegA family two-component response regulator